MKRTNKELFYIWITAVCFSATLLIVFALIFVILVNSLGYFWTPHLQQFQLKNGKQFLGEVQKEEQNLEGENLVQLKIANRDFYGFDFQWIKKQEIEKITTPKEVFLIERAEYGDFYGFFANLKKKEVESNFEKVKTLLDEKKEVDKEIKKLNYRIRKTELQLLKEQLAESDSVQKLKNQLENLQNNFSSTVQIQNQFSEKLTDFRIRLKEIGGAEKELLLENIVRFYQPNEMGFFDKVSLYLEKSWEFLSANPREANTEGGIFPIIFGTVMLVFVMSIFCYPFGLAAAIYLSEYAKENWLTRFVRIAVNNLAGVPSIVYGIFGLSFFIYGIGGFIDQVFFPERLPTPTFGTGGILWASLTLSVLTLPIVIVATEEALHAVPRGMKESSLALGATPTQTLFSISIPVALPGIITGFILAIARAAGEVAPLLITGVVKLAPTLPIDGNFPFFHLDRKFMHLGFHIFDIAFQSPNVEASRPIVFVSTLLLLLIVILLCSIAIFFRERLRKKYKSHQI